MVDERRCEHCEWNGGFYVAPDRSVTEKTLKCRARPPIATGGMMAPTMTIWPAVRPDDWCAEFVPALREIHAIQAARIDWKARVQEAETERDGTADGWRQKVAEVEADRDAALAGVERLTEALALFVQMEKSIIADLMTAHASRGNGASEWMREDDRDMRKDIRKAFQAARAALNAKE